MWVLGEDLVAFCSAVVLVMKGWTFRPKRRWEEIGKREELWEISYRHATFPWWSLKAEEWSPRPCRCGSTTLHCLLPLPPSPDCLGLYVKEEMMHFFTGKKIHQTTYEEHVLPAQHQHSLPNFQMFSRLFLEFLWLSPVPSSQFWVYKSGCIIQIEIKWKITLSAWR